MEQRTLVKWLKILVLFAAVCGELSRIFLLLLAVAHLSVGAVGSVLYGSVSGMEDL